MSTKKSSCKDVLDRLPLYVGGELDQPDEQLVLAHLGHCARCAGEEQKLERAQAAFGASLRAPALEIADPGLWTGIQARLIAEDLIRDGSSREVQAAERRTQLRALHSGDSQPRFQLLRRAGGLVAAAALLLIASQVGFDLAGNDHPGNDPSAGPVTGIESSVGSLAGGPRSFDLPVRFERADLEEFEERMQPVQPGETSLTQDAVLFVPRLSQRAIGTFETGASSAAGTTSLVGNTGRVEVELR